MPYHLVSAGEIALAEEFNETIASQVVSRFTDSTQRSTQLAGPAVGQLSALANRAGGLDIWTGAEWAPVAPYTQYGRATLATNAGGGTVLYFPVAFASPPDVVCVTDMGAGGSDYVTGAVLGDQIIEDRVGLVFRRASDGALFGDAFVNIGWTATGLRAAT